MNHRYLALALAGTLIAPAAMAQKPRDASPLEFGRDYVQESMMVSNGTRAVDARTGATTGLFNLDFVARSGSPEEQARQFLSAYASEAGFASSGLTDLEAFATTSGPAGNVVRFRQLVGGVPVLGSATAVNVLAGGQVPMAFIGYIPGMEIDSAVPAISATDARSTALAHLAFDSQLITDASELVVAPTEEGARLAWLITLADYNRGGQWESLVDARTGELFRVADRSLNHHGEGEGGDDGPSLIPTVDAITQATMVNATGMIFLPNPLTRAGASYGQAGYVEGGTTSQCITENGNAACDADSPQLTAARTAVTLRDVTFDGTNYTLTGPWTKAIELEAPNRGTFPQATADWSFTRNNNAFEAANTYYHIDRYMRYMNDTLGVTVRPYQAARNGIVEFDAHGFSGQDNSRYYGGSTGGRLSFGEGGVDDNEDSDVIIHELGHGIHDWLTLGGAQNGDGLGEGMGDYLAASYVRHMNLVPSTSPTYNWVYRWDGHNPFWDGRVTNYAATYPAGTAPHGRGQHWGTSNMRICNAIGGQNADRAVLEGIRMTNGSTLQPAAAQAVLQAARNMGYQQSYLDAMLASYQQQGYTVTMPTVANEVAPGQAGALALGNVLPNPASGRASLSLTTGQAQDVEVALFDVLGRQVATLFSGAVGAGEVRTLNVETAALPAGVYVIRATSGRVNVTRQLTIAH